MKQYKVLLFDGDETLLDFKEAERQALKDTFHVFGYACDEKILTRYHQINHGLWRDFERGRITKVGIQNTRFQMLFDEFGLAQEEGIAPVFQKSLAGQAPLIEGAARVIAGLYEKYPLYIVTNGVASTQRNRLRLSGLADYFQAVFTSEEIGYPKPTAEFFQRCFHQIPDLEVSKTLIIGDSLSADMAGGAAAGIDTCWFNPEGARNEENIPITMEIRQLTELMNLL